MRNYFFEKGKEFSVNSLHFVMVPHRLDCQSYALQRVEDAVEEYVPDYYTSCCTHPHFLRYFTSWQEKQVVPKLCTPKKQSKAVNSKKSLAWFLQKKKGENDTSLGRIEPLTPKKQVGRQKASIKSKGDQVNVLYVQLEKFTALQLPQGMEKLKELLMIVYLMGCTISRELGFWPVLIPVVNGRGDIKFIKRGKSKQEQILSLLAYFYDQRSQEQWSHEVKQIIEKHKQGKSKLQQVREIQQYLQKQITATCKVSVSIEGSFKVTDCRLKDENTLTFPDMNHDIVINDFMISYHHKDENTRQVILEHSLQHSVLIEGSSSNFIIKYLKVFKIN